MALSLTNSTGNKYGPIPIDCKLEIPDGYSVFVGKNNAGKSCLLQLIFREVRSHGMMPPATVGFIPADRSYIRNTTSPSNTLHQYNENLFNSISGQPRTYASSSVVDADSLYSLLLHQTDFIKQVNEINKYMLRLGFDEIVLKATQIPHVRDVQIISQGTGVRSVLPVIAALTSKEIKLVLIDEPELALEARSQRVLKELFLEAAENGKMIVVATQSHIFLNKQQDGCNFVVDSSTGESTINRITDRHQLLDITYGMLGNSLEDLFFPSNFLIVEGSSDQVVCEKVAQLLGVPPEKVKIISARGIDNIQDSFKAIRNTLVPLVAGESPYSKRVVVLADNPPKRSAASFETLKGQLKERCILLKEFSVEEHLPEELYRKANLDKSTVITTLIELKEAHKHGQKGETLKQLEDYKKLISGSIASTISHDDLELLPTITGAVKLAAKMAES